MCDKTFCRFCTQYATRLDCPQVTAAFGPTRLKRGGTAPERHWTHRTGGRRPKARIDAQGRKLCSQCDTPRASGSHLCVTHRREYLRAYTAANRERLNAKRRLERSHA